MNKVIESLLEGNRRAMASGQAAPQSSDRRPVAAVLTCTDERIIPQPIFDQPPGRLYMVRVAGNVMTPEIAGSLELGVLRLGCSVILVLGHTDCTAVKMARDSTWNEGLAFDIERRVRYATSRLNPDAALDELVKANVEGSIRELRVTSRTLADLESNGKVVIAGAIYCVETGKVEMLKT
jgi:carbonic anhydrase